ncbi:MAG: GxxExxY protein [Candidatus Omnitrophota bacterium]|nr:GxxExxY protein [Candidatus Omnitrophota bacterium]
MKKVILELKVKSGLEPIDEAQIITYLKSTGYRIGILANFGSKKLEFRRFIV